MVCDLCHKNEAIFFVEQTSNNEKVKLKFCADCVKERGFSTDPENISKAITSIFSEIFGAKKINELLCPVCGARRSNIKRGLVGCPECYEIFKDDIIDYMKRKNIYGEYLGLMPKRISNFRSALTDRIVVQKKLEKAIQDEDYEKAAFYRDYLHAIENKAVADGEE